MQFIIGVISSLTATVLIYLFRYQLGFLINFLFAKVYPNVSGEYRIYQYDYSSPNEDEYIPEDHEDTDDSQEDEKQTLSTDASDHQLLDWLKELEKDNEDIYKIELSQFANRVKGEVFSIVKGKRKILEKVQGRITPSRVLMLNSETEDEDHHNFGTYLLTIKNDTRILKGTNSALCISCGDATSGYMILEKE